MMQRDPKARPTASQALWQLENIVSQQRGMDLRWRLQESNEPVGRRFASNIKSATREVLFILKKVAGENDPIVIQRQSQPLKSSSIATPFLLGMALLAVPRSLLSALIGSQSFFHRLFGRSPPGPAEPSPWQLEYIAGLPHGSSWTESLSLLCVIALLLQSCICFVLCFVIQSIFAVLPVLIALIYEVYCILIIRCHFLLL